MTEAETTLERSRVALSALIEQSKNDESDHFILCALNTKVDLMAVVLLGDGNVEASLAYQVLELRKWKAQFEKTMTFWFTRVALPLMLMILTALLWLLWDMLNHRITIVPVP